MIAEFMTVSGRRMDLIGFSPSLVGIEDIAWHLAMTCRFGGAVRTWYSNAQHSVLVAELVLAAFEHLFMAEQEQVQAHRQSLPVCALVHDGAEAYTGDLTRPMKLALRFFAGMAAGLPRGAPSTFDAVEHRIATTIEHALDLPPGLVAGDHPQYWVIKDADYLALQIEDAILRPDTGRDLNRSAAALVDERGGSDVEAYAKRYIELGRWLRDDRWPTAERAAQGFLARYFDLTKDTAAQ